jgi:HEPN domain-containing protein
MGGNLGNIDIVKVREYWLSSSIENWDTMINLYNSKTYHWALFMGHISTEKLLKGLFVQLKGKHAPPIHNLYRLAELCELNPNEQYSDWLDVVTSFNINARYDDYKRDFYLRCNKEFASLWIKRIKIMQEWIRQML